MRTLLIGAGLLALLLLAPRAAAQPFGDDLDGLIALLETRVAALEQLPAPTKPEKKLAKLLGKQLKKLQKPSDRLSKDARALKRVAKPLEKKLADDAVVQQELLVAAEQLRASVQAGLDALAVELANLVNGPAVQKAQLLKAKAESLLAASAVPQPMKKRAALITKAAKRLETSGAKAAQAASHGSGGCFGEPLGPGDFVTALADGVSWSPASLRATVIYAPDGQTVAGFSVLFDECPLAYRWLRYTIHEAPQIGLYTNSIFDASKLSVGASADPATGVGFLGGVGIGINHFDLASETVHGSFYGFLPLPPPGFEVIPLTQGSFSIQGFDSVVQQG